VTYAKTGFGTFFDSRTVRVLKANDFIQKKNEFWFFQNSPDAYEASPDAFEEFQTAWNNDHKLN